MLDGTTGLTDRELFVKRCLPIVDWWDDVSGWKKICSGLKFITFLFLMFAQTFLLLSVILCKSVKNT